MIRISNVALPLGYTAQTLRKKAAARLRIPERELQSCRLGRRSVDARRKQAVHFLAALDVTVAGDEAALVRRLKNPDVKVIDFAPYPLPQPAAGPQQRPVVVGSGPAGLFAALMRPEGRGADGGCGALSPDGSAGYTLQCTVRGGRCRYLFRRQAEHRGAGSALPPRNRGAGAGR